MAIEKGNAPPNVPSSLILGRMQVLVVAVESADESRSVMRRIKRNGSGMTLGERVDDLPNLWGGQFQHLFDGDARLGNSVRMTLVAKDRSGATSGDGTGVVRMARDIGGAIRLGKERRDE